jgi:uncharacterized membrane protein
MKVENTIRIDATESRVWALTLDLEAWPRYSPTMTEVTRLDDGPVGVGSRARVKQPAQSAKIWTVTELEPEKTFTWTTRAMGMTMVATHEVEATAGGTLNHLRVEATGGLSSILGPLLKAPIAKAIAQENQGFKRAAEG